MKQGYNMMIADDFEELQELVENMLDMGWQLAGGAIFVEKRDKSGFGAGWAQTLYHPNLHKIPAISD